VELTPNGDGTRNRGYWSVVERESSLVPSPASTAELLVAEDAGWGELHALMDSLTPDQALRPGYFAEGWSAKDVLAHIGCWLAEAGVILVRIRAGTYRSEEIDVDAMNEQFLEAMRDVPLGGVKAQALVARARMLQVWSELPQMTPDAAFWIRKAGAQHYAEHLPRLRAWASEVRST
jgi:hypothetical protein